MKGGSEALGTSPVWRLLLPSMRFSLGPIITEKRSIQHITSSQTLARLGYKEASWCPNSRCGRVGVKDQASMRGGQGGGEFCFHYELGVFRQLPDQFCSLLEFSFVVGIFFFFFRNVLEIRSGRYRSATEEHLLAQSRGHVLWVGALTGRGRRERRPAGWGRGTAEKPKAKKF